MARIKPEIMMATPTFVTFSDIPNMMLSHAERAKPKAPMATSAVFTVHFDPPDKKFQKYLKNLARDFRWIAAHNYFTTKHRRFRKR